MAQVLLTDVSKIYPGNVTAVDRVSLNIADREFVVLVGPSGCGKSTTLRMIAGLEDVSSGTIQIGERVVNDVAPKDRDIAMVFQNYALYPNMTVYRNMAFGLMLRRKFAAWDNPIGFILSNARWRAARDERKQIDQKVRNAAQILGIENLLDRRPKALSGGQRQRVAVGRAIVRAPKAFLFDEPLSNLDAKLRVEMRSELKKLHRRLQTTTVYVTHDQEEAMTLGDRIVVMKDGVIQQAGTPLEVYERPVNRFVAGFVGVPPMNFLSGRLSRDSDALWFADSENRIRVSDAHCARLNAFAGRDIVLGVRPELLTPVDHPVPGRSLRGKVTVVEPLGDRQDVIISASGCDKIICRVDARKILREGDLAHMQLDLDRVHFFQPDQDGRNVSLPSGPPQG